MIRRRWWRRRDVRGWWRRHHTDPMSRVLVRHLLFLNHRECHGCRGLARVVIVFVGLDWARADTDHCLRGSSRSGYRSTAVGEIGVLCRIRQHRSRLGCRWGRQLLLLWLWLLFLLRQLRKRMALISLICRRFNLNSNTSSSRRRELVFPQLLPIILLRNNSRCNRCQQVQIRLLRHRHHHFEGERGHHGGRDVGRR